MPKPPAWIGQHLPSEPLHWALREETVFSAIGPKGKHRQQLNRLLNRGAERTLTCAHFRDTKWNNCIEALSGPVRAHSHATEQLRGQTARFFGYSTSPLHIPILCCWNNLCSLPSVQEAFHPELNRNIREYSFRRKSFTSWAAQRAKQ